MKGTDKTVDLLAKIRGKGKSQDGLKVIKVQTTEPNAITFTFEGSNDALDLDIFEIPVSCYPLRRNDRLLVFPLVGDGNSQRWAVIEKINGGAVTMATMQSSSSLKINGIDKTYGSNDLIVPPFLAVGNSTSNSYLVGSNIRPLQSGDRVGIAPVIDGGRIKYVILERY